MTIAERAALDIMCTLAGRPDMNMSQATAAAVIASRALFESLQLTNEALMERTRHVNPSLMVARPAGNA